MSMTRAQDLLVFARPMKALNGEWMKTISLSDWLPTSDGPSILLNNGEMVPFKRRIFDPNTAAIANPSAPDRTPLVPGTRASRREAPANRQPL